jgi:predicted RNA-binding protein Jag
MSQKFEGRNLEEALKNAAEGLGVERWQLSHHIILEKRGFLGGMKRVVIEADVDAAAAPPPAPPAPLPPLPRSDAPRGDRGGARRGGPGGGDRSRGPRGGGRGGSREGGSREGGRGRGGRGQGHNRELRVGDFETFILDLPEQGPESEAAKAAREWCETALRLAHLDAVVRSEENETQIVLRLYGADSRRLVDRNGELLDAIQVLANKTLAGRATEKDIELDCEEFKERRTDDLEQRARAAADRVRGNGREELLPPMSPIERRIVHIALRDDADVTTESRGDGFFKRVAIVLRGEAAGEGETVRQES